MKLSGMLSELPPDLQNASGDEIFGKIVPWLIVILTAFKPHRIMFGSDWPVCEANIGGEAWTKWAWIVERFCDVAGLGDVEKGMVWGGTASKAYGIYGGVAEKVKEEEEEEQKIPAARGTAARLRAASKAMP
jgi:L-rhamnono-1,4-lactonase